MVKYLLILSFIPLSCGTVHQMIPPAPLEHHQNRVDFIATFDFNSAHPFPDFDMAFYWGVGQDYNLGFGLSHVSIAKYFNNDDKQRKYLFASFDNIPIPLHFHANFELGGGIIERHGQDTQSFSAGIWFVFNETFISPLWFYPLWMDLDQDTLHMTRRVVAGPFIKYSYDKRNVGFSLQNYLGMTRVNLSILRKRRLASNPSIVLKNSDVDSIYHDISRWPNRYVISIVDRENLLLLAELPFDLWFPDRDILMINKYRYDNDTRVYYLMGYNNVFESMYEVNIKQVIEDYKNGKDLILRYNPANTKKITKKIKWYKDDWSVGVRWKE